MRYIGKASDPRKRLLSHMRAARDPKRNRTPVYCWINSLTARGEAPAMRVLAEVPEADWPQAERLLIELRRRTKGAKLLNLADGGDEPGCSRAQRALNGAAVAKTRNPVIWRARKFLGTELFIARRDGWACAPKLERAIALFDAARPELKQRMALALGVPA